MKKILIIEDDSLVAELERDYLEAEAFDVELCEDGKIGLERCLADFFSLVILDVMLPSMSGFEVLREIRKTRNLPVILVSAKLEDVDKIRGLGLGADDYIVKPFSPAELVARVKSHIQIHERLLQERDGKSIESSPDEITCGALTIHPLSRRVFLGGKELSLKNKEFDLLCFLASNPEIVFTKESLLEKVWGLDCETDNATVTVHINRIREKIEDNPSKPRYIQTVWGSGYKFLKQ